MQHEHKCSTCGQLFVCNIAGCRFEDRKTCDRCSLEATKDNAFSMVTRRLLVCIREGRNCGDCFQDCGLNENRDRIKRHA